MAEVVVHSSHDSNPHDSNQEGGATHTITRATAPGLVMSPQYPGQQQAQHGHHAHILSGGPVVQQQTDSEQVTTHHVMTQAPRPSSTSINAERILMTQPTITNHDDHGAQAHVTVVINPSVPGAPLSSHGNRNRRRRRGGRSTPQNSQNDHRPTVPATPEGTTLSTHVSNAGCDDTAVKRPNTIYEQHLVSKGLGFPLWTPQPNMQLPKEYRVKGVMIGDVGIITKYGAFDFWFNICLAAMDTINPPDLPEGFEQLPLQPGDTRGFREFTAGSYLTSSTVKQAKHTDSSRRGTTFESSAAEGAVLSIPNGAYREELNNIASFRKYMAIHVESWYLWAKRRGREVQNGDIRLVIGNDKATSWGMACFVNTSSRQKKCSLTFLQNEEYERATGCPYAWEHTGTSVDVKAGPDLWDAQDLWQIDDPPLLNQCLFLRTLNVLLSDDLWASMHMNGAPGLNVPGWGNNSYNSPNLSKQYSTNNDGASSSSRLPDSPSRNHAAPQHRAQHDEEPSFPEDTEYALRHSHPSYALNAWLMEEMESSDFPKPKMVVTDDSVWVALGSMVNALLDPSENPDLINHCFDQVLKSHDIEAIQSDSSVTMYLNPKDSTDRAHAEGLVRVPSLMGDSRENGNDNSTYSADPFHLFEEELSDMDVIESCLGIAPVPGLGLAFKVFKSIFASVQEAQGFKEQLIVLSASIAAILKALDRQYRDGKLSEISTRKELDDLNGLMWEISAFTQKKSAYNLLKLMFVKELALSTIDGYASRLDATVNAFQIAAPVSIQHWQTKNDRARISDRAALHARLAQMESNQKLLNEALSIQHSSELALMTTLQRRIKDRGPDADPKELEFFSHSLRYLETKTGETVDIQPWTISPFDVEFGHELGSGGLGRVYKGTWNQMDVAVKLMKNREKISPSAEVIRREVDIWSKLNHPHILQFLGANILDDDPFIVMPLILNGNILSFIRKHPNCDRLKFIYHISLGLVYLHSKGVVHGDLKGVNVLVGDGEKSLLCDFGLSRIKADVNSRSSVESTALFGSRNWMAPELFQGGRPKAPSDMYSFGMTIYEIYMDEIPLGHLHPETLHDAVVRNNTRPDRPDESEAPTLTDDVWRLATECWAAKPAFRPAAPIICDRLQKLYSTQRHPAPEQDARDQLNSATAPPPPTETHHHTQPPNLNYDSGNVTAANSLLPISPANLFFVNTTAPTSMNTRPQTGDQFASMTPTSSSQAGTSLSSQLYPYHQQAYRHYTQPTQTQTTSYLQHVLPPGAYRPHPGPGYLSSNPYAQLQHPQSAQYSPPINHPYGPPVPPKPITYPHLTSPVIHNVQTPPHVVQNQYFRASTPPQNQVTSPQQASPYLSSTGGPAPPGGLPYARDEEQDGRDPDDGPPETSMPWVDAPAPPLPAPTEGDEPATVLAFDDEAYARKLAAEEEAEYKRWLEDNKKSIVLADPTPVTALPLYSLRDEQQPWQGPSSAGPSSSAAGPSSPPPRVDSRPGPSTSFSISSTVQYPALAAHRESDADTRSEISHHSGSSSVAGQHAVRASLQANSSQSPPIMEQTQTQPPPFQSSPTPSTSAPATAPPSMAATTQPASTSTDNRFSQASNANVPVGVLNPNHFLDRELLHGVSIGFKAPVISIRLLPMDDPMPNIISLPYARCPPLHLQSPNWMHLLRLMARLSGTRIEPTVEAMAISKTELKLRTVVQFVKPHPQSPDWRTILWFSIDHPIPPAAPGAHRYLSHNPNLLPWSYSLSPVPMILRDTADTHISKTYTIPPSQKVPLPNLPITFPNLALYFQAAIDHSRRHADDPNGIGKLGKMVQQCYPSIDQPPPEYDIRERGERKILNNFRSRKNGRQTKTGTNNEETYQLVTPFVPDEWG